MYINPGMYYSLNVITDWRDCKNLTNGNFYHDNLVDSLRLLPSGQCIASFFGGVACVPTTQLYMPMDGSVFDDDPDDDD